MFGLNTGLLGVAAAVRAAFAPTALFAASEVGAWYDPSDLSTMFQDSAGTTPVTADGQPVGLILDKSKGLALGPELVTNGDFSSGATGWTLGNGWTISSGVATANTTMGNETLEQVYAGETGVTYHVTATVTMLATPHPVASVGINIGGVGEDLFCSTSTGLVSGNSYQINTRVKLTTASSFRIQVRSGNGLNYPLNYTIDNISVKKLYGNHASQATAASRPLYKTDGTYHWLQFDGVDDYLATAAIDFTAVKQLSIFSGNSTAAVEGWLQFVLLGNLVANGSFAIQIPQNGTNGSAISYPTAAPSFKQDTWANAGLNVKNVLSHIFNNNAATRQVVTRKNAAEVGFVSGTPYDSGFKNDVLRISGAGAEAFKGNVYSLIIRGALSTADEITATETWVNSKTGAY